MLTEQQKLVDALRKAEEFKKAFIELTPENRKELVKAVLQVTSLQEAFMKLKMML